MSCAADRTGTAESSSSSSRVRARSSAAAATASSRSPRHRSPGSPTSSGTGSRPSSTGSGSASSRGTASVRCRPSRRSSSQSTSRSTCSSRTKQPCRGSRWPWPRPTLRGRPGARCATSRTWRAATLARTGTFTKGQADRPLARKRRATVIRCPRRRGALTDHEGRDEHRQDPRLPCIPSHPAPAAHHGGRRWGRRRGRCRRRPGHRRHRGPRPRHNGEVVRLSVLGTTDLHGNVLNWDYFKNTEYTDSRANDIGVAKASSIIKTVKAEVGAARTITLDAGDTIQGTPLAYYFAKIDPITGGSTHPMAAAMNQSATTPPRSATTSTTTASTPCAPSRSSWISRCSRPTPSTGNRRPVFKPWSSRRSSARHQGDQGRHPRARHAWRRDLGRRQRRGQGPLPGHRRAGQGHGAAPQGAGADVVIVACHSGDNGASSWGDALPYVENASALLAQQVPGIDAILVGHAHLEIRSAT